MNTALKITILADNMATGRCRIGIPVFKHQGKD